MLTLCWLCLIAFQTDSNYYEGTLTVKDRNGPCEAQPESQRVMLVMNEENDRVEGYLAFTDKRLAKIEGKPGEPLQVTFSAADPARAEIWHWHLERVENGLAGHLEGKRSPDTQDCQTKQVSISLVARKPFRTNFDQRARQFQALELVARVDKLLAKNENTQALEVIEQALHLASDRQEVHEKAGEIVLGQDDPSKLVGHWLNLGLGQAHKGIDFRGAVAWVLMFRCFLFKKQEKGEKALEALEHARKLNSGNHQLLALAGQISADLEKEDEAVGYFHAAVAAILPRLDEEPELRQDMASYHAAISGLRGTLPAWARSKLEDASVIPENPESQTHLEAWEETNERIIVSLREGSYQNSIPIAKENYQKAVSWFGVSHPKTITSLNNLAVLYQNQGAYEAALPLYEEVLKISIEMLGRRHPQTLSVKNNLAFLYQSQGAYDLAQPLFEETLKLRQEMLGARHPQTLNSLNNLAALYESQGAYDTAQLLIQEALKLSQEVLGTYHPQTLSSLNNLAAIHQSQGAYDLAQTLFEEALKLSQKVFGAQHPQTLMVLNNLAALYESQGAFEAAQPLVEEALVLRKDVLGARHPYTLTSLNNLAALYESQGAYEAAQPLFEEALRLSREMLGTRHPQTLISVNNLAALYQSQSAYEVAKPLLEEALRIRREVLGVRHPDTLMTLNNLAAMYESQGAYESAQPLFVEVLRIYMEELGARHPQTLMALNNLAGLYESRGAYEAAQPLFVEALGKSKEVLGKQHPTTLTVLTNLAALSARLGNGQTSEYFLEAARSSTAYLQRISGLDARTRRIFLKTNHEYLRHLLFSYFSQKSASSFQPEILSFAMTRKGLLFQMASDIHWAAMAQSKHDGTTALQQLQRCRTELSANTQRAVLGMTTQDDDQQLMRELERLERELGRQLLETTSHPDQLAEKVIHAIPDDAILVDFQGFFEKNFETGKFLDERLIAFIVNPQSDQNIQLVKLESPIAEIRKDVEALRKAISSPDRPALLKQAGERLYGHIWKPLAPYFGDSQKVYLVPDGVLHLLPWGALKDENGRYLATTTNIAVLASGMDLIRNPITDSVPTKSGKPHLVFAPNYDLELGEATHPLSNINPPFKALDGALEEGLRLTELFRKYGKEPITSQRDEATETWVSQLKSPSLLHFATHGQFLGSKGASLEGRGANGPLLRNLEQAEARVYSEFLPGERPLLASGLALAGANGIVKGRRAEDHTDGLLSAFEVLSIDLRGTDLVVLSACDTGLGEVNNGDGVYSLNRAFLEAGAKNVLATLWKIDDKATVAFMESFYDLYLQGHAPREALRLTQTKFMASETYSHPYYWAPFILVGPD